MPCPAEWPGLAELFQAGWSFSGCTSTFGASLLFSSPWSSLFSAVGWLPDAASIGSHRKPMQCEVILLPQGWLRPVDQGFWDLLSQLLLMPCLKRSSHLALLRWEMADYPQRLQTNSFRGIETMKWAAFPQLNASEVWGYHFVVTLQFDARLPKSGVKGRDRPWYYKISPSQWNIRRHCWSYLHQGSKQIFTGLWLERN